MIERFNTFKGRKKFFKHYPEKLQEMLSLRQKGMSSAELGRMYGIDHSSILFQCKRYGVVPSEKGVMEFKAIMIKKKAEKVITTGFIPRYEYETGEKINSGMDYKDYLRIEKEKQLKRLLNKQKK